MLITRSLPDGSLDPTFAGNGALRWSLATNNASRALLPTAAGQLLFLARLTSPSPFGPAPIFFVVGRLHENGTLDPTWGASGIATPDLGATFVDAVHAVLDPQGRVLIAGTRAIALGSLAEVFLARLDAGGALDPSFAGSGWQGVTACGSSLTTVSDLEFLANGQAEVAVTCGSAGASSAQIDFEVAALRLASDTLFSDNFEAGFGRWSVVTGLATP